MHDSLHVVVIDVVLVVAGGFDDCGLEIGFTVVDGGWRDLGEADAAGVFDCSGEACPHRHC